MKLKTENASLNMVTIIPNPNNGEFTLTFRKNNEVVGIKEVEVMDITGKVIWTNESTPNNVLKIDISSFSKGIYYVRAINESGEMEMKKLIKQ